MNPRSEETEESADLMTLDVLPSPDGKNLPLGIRRILSGEGEDVGQIKIAHTAVGEISATRPKLAALVAQAPRMRRLLLQQVSALCDYIQKTEWESYSAYMEERESAWDDDDDDEGEDEDDSQHVYQVAVGIKASIEELGLGNLL